MKTQLQAEEELQKCIREIQELEGEDWDTLNGWIHALNWVLGKKAE
jgi:hypothetical protein